MRRIAAAFLVFACSVGVATASSRAPNGAATLVLTQKDVGPAYRPTPEMAAAHTLADIDTGASASLKRELAAKFVVGSQSGFNGVTVRRNIISTADVFRTTKLNLIVRFWERRYLYLSQGKRLAVPPDAPGAHRTLIRGRMRGPSRGWVVLLYQWQRGTTIMTVWQLGPKSSLRPSELFALARVQDAKAR
jgi:hypothetical protein